MALITLLDDNGRPHLVHSSIFNRGNVVHMPSFIVAPDQKRPARAVGDWAEVWKRVEWETEEVV